MSLRIKKPRLKGAASEDFQRKGSKLDLTNLTDFVTKPAVRRKVYSEARSLLGHLKSETEKEESSKALFQKAALSVKTSIRRASLTGEVVSGLTGIDLTGTGRRSLLSQDVEVEDVSVESQEHQEESEADKMRQQFQRSLEDVKELLQQVDLESMANTIEEVAQVVDSIHDLEAMFEAAGRDPEGRDPESCEEQARQTLEVAANCIPNAVDAINRCRSPNTATKVSTALQDFAGFTEKSVALGLPLVKKKKPKGQKRQEQADSRRFSRELLRQHLRSRDNGWTPLPPPSRQEKPRGRDLRSRESWLKWWCHDEGDTLDLREAFFESLPPDKLTLPEMELRDAIIDFLELKKGKDDPRWEEIKVQPMVLECTRKALPNFVSLEEWLHRRQRLNRGISAWPPPQPVWLLEPHERWKKDPPLEPVPLPHTGRFQRRDSTQRRGSSVFGINFTVTDHGHIFGALAGDDEAVCELPWPCSSVVPEQKSFGWIKDQGTKKSLPSVTSRQNMTVEDVMAWRLSHRFRQRRVEPVLQNMWQVTRERPTQRTCKCEHCSGTLQYEITLASEV